MPDGELVAFSQSQRQMLGDLLRSLSEVVGGGDLSLSWTPGGGLTITRQAEERRGPVTRKQDAVVRLTEADGTNGWQYKAEEVIATDMLADPPTYQKKEPGRTFGVNADDEGVVTHPLKIEGLEEPASDADPVYVVRRVVVDGDKPRWVIVGAAGDSLPPPGVQYQALLLLGTPGNLVPSWSYPRAHPQP